MELIETIDGMDDPIYEGQEISVDNSEQEYKVFETPLINLVKKAIGGEDYIMTGDEDEPLKVSLYDLNEKQLTSLLEHHYENQKPDLSDYELDDTEIELINAYRNGDVQSAAKFLGIQQQTNQNISDDDIIGWKIKQMYPDLTDSELETEVELWKESPNSERKLEIIKNEFNTVLSKVQEEENNKIETLKAEAAKKQAAVMIEKINDIKSLYQFKVDDTAKQEIHDMLFVQDDGKTKLAKMLEDPITVLELATSVTLLPKISGYVNQLLDKITELEKNKKIITNNSYTSKQSRSQEGVEDVSEYFRLGRLGK